MNKRLMTDLEEEVLFQRVAALQRDWKFYREHVYEYARA